MAQTHIRTRQDARDAVTAYFDSLSAPMLLKLANALQRVRPDPERLAQTVLEVASDEPSVRTLSGSGLGRVISAAQGKAQIDAISVEDDRDDQASEMLGAGEIASRLGVARTSLDNWRRAHKVLALRKGVRNYIFPLRQFERHAPVEGLDLVRMHFASDEVAWDWLITPNAHTDDTEPLEWLRAGKIVEVVRAAEGALDYQ